MPFLYQRYAFSLKRAVGHSLNLSVSVVPKRPFVTPFSAIYIVINSLAGLDEDVSFESFEYEDAEPTALQRFFLMHKEINVAEFARSMDMNPTLLRNYINGFKKPSKERKQEIINRIHELGMEILAA